jgi:YD repeat-containing protein
VTIVSDIDYLPFGPANVITFGNGRALTKTYDQDYGIDAVTDSATGGLSIDLGLDDVGNVTAIDERLTTGATAARTVTYDGMDRLTALKNGGTALQSFAYDATGNRTNAGVSNPYTYETNSHRLTQVNSMPRTNDVVGNTTGYGARGFGYDDAGRLTKYFLSSVLSTEYA